MELVSIGFSKPYNIRVLIGLIILGGRIVQDDRMHSNASHSDSLPGILKLL